MPVDIFIGSGHVFVKFHLITPEVISWFLLLTHCVLPLLSVVLNLNRLSLELCVCVFVRVNILIHFREFNCSFYILTCSGLNQLSILVSVKRTWHVYTELLKP